LLLAVIGLYGVMSFVVTQRSEEIGVRMALGATRATALWLIVRDASMMIAAGRMVALPVVWVVRRRVESQLFGVSVLHLPTIGGAAAVLIAVGLAAALLPAWRAASVNPGEALRN
jgi:ABC-type antimicrobial peptide transport system permease subunit